MKKLFKEGKRDFKTELKGISTVILWFLLSNHILSQVPINGFCQVKSFSAFPGYDRLTISDINYDSVNDIILYSSSKRSTAVIEGEIDSSITNYKIHYTAYRHSNIVPVFNKRTGSEQFIFTSRKSRIFGWFDFSNFGRYNLITKIRFDSFPENISVADINRDGSSEFLISGSGFKGLSVLTSGDDELPESKIEVNSSYGEAVFAEISNDDYPDIAAFNLLTKSLDIFYNDGKGNYEKIRTIKSSINIENLKSMDLNRDKYDDLIYSSNNLINIIFGDFQSSYDSSIIINTEYIPHRYVVSDFNRDRLFDIAYIDTTRGLLSVIFGMGNNKFYPEVFYMKTNGLTDLFPVRSGEFRGLVLLNKKGEINIISKLSTLPDETHLIPAVQPSTIASFDFKNDGMPDICYVDDNNTMNFLVNNAKGIPSLYYSASLSGDHKIIIVDDFNPTNKSFYCYTPESNMLEIIDYDFIESTVKSDQIYLRGLIKDLKINRTDDLVHIFLTYEKDGKLKVGEYEHHDFRYTFREYPEIGTDAIASELYVTDYPVVYFWKAGDDSIRHFKAILGSRSAEFKQLGAISNEEDPLIKNIEQYLFDKENPVTLTLLNSNTDYFSVVSGDSLFNFSNSIFKRNSFNIGNENKLVFESTNGKDFESAVLYLAEDQSFDRIELKDEELLFTKLFDSEKVTDFIVRKIISDKKYLIYTQQSEGFISLKRLK
jgi:hypothetical protein